jgi:hypothetical protein
LGVSEAHQYKTMTSEDSNVKQIQDEMDKKEVRDEASLRAQRKHRAMSVKNIKRAKKRA